MMYKKLFLLPLLLLGFASCNKKEDTGIIDNGGCPIGYSGTACQTAWNDGLAGDWRGSYTSATGTSTGRTTIRIASDPKVFYMDNFLGYYNDVACEFTSSTTFLFKDGAIVSGSGLLSNGGRLINATFNDGYGNMVTLQMQR